MAIKPETDLFAREPLGSTGCQAGGEVAIQMEPRARPLSGDSISTVSDYENPLGVVRDAMATPTRALVNATTNMLRCCDSELMAILGVLRHPPDQAGIESSLGELKSAMARFDEADLSLVGHRELPSSYSSHPDLVALFLFIHPLRQAAGSVDLLASKVIEISQDPRNRKKRLFLPSYPIKKAIYRTNPQVRHDRGGVSAGYYFRIKEEISQIMGKIHARAFVLDALTPKDSSAVGKEPAGIGGTADEDTLRYRTWKALHRLQQFESRFAVKTILVTVTLSAPAWAESSRGWWSKNESWWAVVAAWLMMHPRVGGNAQDLVTRTIATVFGAAWGGLACAASSSAGSGGPFVLAIFALVFMVPAGALFRRVTRCLCL